MASEVQAHADEFRDDRLAVRHQFGVKNVALFLLASRITERNQLPPIMALGVCCYCINTQQRADRHADIFVAVDVFNAVLLANRKPL